MDVQRISGFSDSESYEPWNRILSQTSGANAQLTHEWLSSWWEVFGQDKTLCLVSVTDGDRIVGMAPLVGQTIMDTAGFVLRKLTFAGDGVTDYHDLLTVPEQRKEIIRLLLEYLAGQEWDVIHLRNVRGDSPNLPVLREALRKTPLSVLERVNIRSPYVPIDGSWTDYYGRLSKNMRSDIRRRSNHLAKVGKVQFVRIHEIDEVAPALEIIKSIHIKCRQAQGGTSWFADAQRYRFASLVLERFSRHQWLDVVYLMLDGQVIAYYLGFAYNNVVHFWNTGFNPAFSQFSPGKVLLYHWLQDSFAQGYREFDFMVGEEPYKLQWTDAVRPNYEIFLFKKTVRSQILRCCHTHSPVFKKNRYLRKMARGIGRRIGA